MCAYSLQIEKFLPLIVGLIIFGNIFYFFFYSNKKRIAVLKKLSVTLAGSVSKFSLNPDLKGEYQGLKFSIVLTPSNDNTPAHLNISLFKNSFLKLRIYQESFLSKLGKKIGLVHEVKTNDPSFDAEFLIFSNKPDQALTYLSNAASKNIIKELFQNGFNILTIDGKKIFIKKPNYSLETDFEPAKIVDILQKLSTLVRGLTY